MKRLFLILGLLASSALAQTTTTITGTIKDLTQALVTSGKVTFTLQPSADTAMSGIARFTPNPPVTCLINASGNIVAMNGVSACVITMNTALQPVGTYYRVDYWPYYVKTGSFTFYAVLAAYDWSTVVPTPTTSPAQNFVDIFSNQSIGGNKTFSGQTSLGTTTIANLSGTIAGDITWSGLHSFTNVVTGLSFRSLSVPLATSGWLRAGSTDTGCWRNAGGTADLCIGSTSNVGGTDFLSVNGLQIAPHYILDSDSQGITIAVANASGPGNITLLGANASGTNNNGSTIHLEPGTKGSGGSNGDVVIDHGICKSTATGNGTGCIHVRTASCTTAASAGATCTTTVTWYSVGTSFDDTNYTAACTISGGTGSVTGVPYVLNTSSKTTSAMTVTIAALTAAAASGTIDCIGMHD